MTRVARDPLFICLVLGMVVFVVDGWLGRPPQQHIEVTAADVARVDAQWRAEMGRPPTEQELSALIDRHVREEVLYREALRLDLDRNDTIVRRRLAQKLQFVSEDLGTGDPPTEKALRAYYEAHRENYVRHARVTFSHVYWSSDRHTNPVPLARAALQQLAAGEGDEWRTHGDPFLLQRAYAERTYDEIAQLFGRNFAEALPDLALDTWQGPIQSAYGVHAVRVEARQLQKDQTFQEALADVRRDLQAERRREANESYYAGLRQRYRVEITPGALGNGASE